MWEDKKKKERTDTEPRVHLLWVAVLQQGLNQDIQIFFRGLLGELLLTWQTKEDGIEMEDKRERDKQGGGR